MIVANKISIHQGLRFENVKPLICQYITSVQVYLPPRAIDIGEAFEALGLGKICFL